MTLVNRLARLSAAERRRIVQEFVDEVFHGLDTADQVLRELPGDADPATVLDRLRSHTTDRGARYRELLAIVKGTGPEAAYRKEFAWVAAALAARAGG